MIDRVNPRTFGSTIILLAAASLSLGCAKEKPAETPEAAPEAPAAEEALPGQDPGQSEIAIAANIASACGIKETDAFFSYNSAKVSPAADALLAKLVECFTTGPLAGKSMSLVGHADPRGDEEFNFVLGGRRSDNVSGALAKKGLPGTQMKTTSRGELDARGQDEASWKADRKVEVFLID